MPCEVGDDRTELPVRLLSELKLLYRGSLWKSKTAAAAVAAAMAAAVRAAGLDAAEGGSDQVEGGDLLEAMGNNVPLVGDL